MTLATAVRETILELTSATPLELTEVPAELVAPNDMGQGTSSAFVDVLVYQLDVDNSQDPSFPYRPGQIVSAQRSYRHPDEWFTINHGNRYYFIGTRVCLEPRAGALYRLYTPDQSSFLCRRNENRRWDIVRGAGMTPHPYENDVLATEPVLWWEVTEETTADAGVSADDPAAEPAPEPDFDAEAFFATAVGAGLVASPVELVNPGEFVDGEMYVYAEAPTDRYIYVAMKMWGSSLPEPMGIWNNYYGYMDTFSSTHRVPENVRWAKMTAPTEASGTHSIRTQRITVNGLNERTTAARQKNYELNVALNELAQENGWCSEYERVMSRIGMRGRSTKYTGTITDVRMTFDVHRKDGADVFASLAQTLGVTDVVSANVTVTVPNLTVEVEANGGPDSAPSYLGASHIREAYEKMLASNGSGMHQSLRIDDMYLSNYNTRDTKWEDTGANDIDLSDLPEVPEETPVEGAPLAE